MMFILSYACRFRVPTQEQSSLCHKDRFDFSVRRLEPELQHGLLNMFQ